MSWSVYLAIPLMAVLVIVQSTILPHTPILGVAPQLYLLFTVAWTLLYGIRDGLLWAFVGGVLVDLFSAAPLGVTPLSMMAAVTVVWLVQRNFPESRVILPVLLAALGTLVFWLVYLLLLRIIVPLVVGNLAFLGVEALTGGARAPGLLREIGRYYGLNSRTLQLIVSMSVIHGLLILPIYWTVYTVSRAITPRRVEI